MVGSAAVCGSFIYDSVEPRCAFSVVLLEKRFVCVCVCNGVSVCFALLSSVLCVSIFHAITQLFIVSLLNP